MIIRRSTPVIVRDGREIALTAQVIVALLAEGLTVRDYEALALAARAYGCSNVAELMAVALRCVEKAVAR